MNLRRTEIGLSIKALNSEHVDCPKCGEHFPICYKDFPRLFLLLSLLNQNGRNVNSGSNLIMVGCDAKRVSLEEEVQNLLEP